MPETTQEWIAPLSTPQAAWADIAGAFTTTGSTVHALDSTIEAPQNPYRRRFRQGAILVPRVLTVVEDAPSAPLGAGVGRRRVSSRRSTQEKRPWKDVATLTHAVETRFVHPMHLGESVVPFRLLNPLLTVLPLTGTKIMSRSDIDSHAGLSAWWAEAEEQWEVNKSSQDTSAFLDRIDFHGQLSAQLPITSTRVVYSASGSTLAAAICTDTSAIIEHKLYWAPVQSLAEGRYLTGILNSRALLERVTPLQAVGLLGPRDFDKAVFRIPYPAYDDSNPDHAALVIAVEDAEREAANTPLKESFQKARKQVRDALNASGVAARMEAAVAAILPTMETMTAVAEAEADAAPVS